MLKIDKNSIEFFAKNGVKKIKIFFYSAGCSGTKVDVLVDDFVVDENLECIYRISESIPFEVYVEKSDSEKFANANITRVVKADHSGEEKVRYIYSNEMVQERCGCGSSFAFEKKKPTINLSKLQEMKNSMQKNTSK